MLNSLFLSLLTIVVPSCLLPLASSRITITVVYTFETDHLHLTCF